MNIYNDSHPSPCFKCEKRWVDEEKGTICHSTCKDFIEFQKFREEKRNEAHKRADQLRALNAIGKYHK